MENPTEIVSNSKKVYKDNHDEFYHSYNDREKATYRSVKMYMEKERTKHINTLIENFSNEKEKDIIQQKLEEIKNTHMKPENILANYNFKTDLQDARSNSKLEYTKLCCYLGVIIGKLCNDMLGKGKNTRRDMLNKLDIIHEFSVIQLEEEVVHIQEESIETLEEIVAKLDLKEFNEDDLEDDED